MLAVVGGATVEGIDGVPVTVEVDIAGGIPGFAMVGLPENTVREARVRVQAAIHNSGFNFPSGKISVNLAPAHLRKDGTGFDLPMALGILAAAGFMSQDSLKGMCFIGELSLSGELRPVRGVLAAAEAARKGKARCLIVAEANASEAALVQDVEVRSAKNFRDVVDFLMTREEAKAPVAHCEESVFKTPDYLDLGDVRGQYQARRALEIAAAGGHNILFSGGPGSGKTMMARRLPGILPPLSYQEALEVTRIHSAAGLTLGKGLVTERPYRSPHHSSTRAGIVGGGSGLPKPGEVSLANYGVLFLDELPEFPRSTLEVLRQPLESQEVVLSRANGSLRYPAKIMLVAAMNPCPCGYYGSKRRSCRCSPQERIRYRGRLSGPLLDRIDLHIDVPSVEMEALHGSKGGECSTSVRERVCKARVLQYERLGEGICNAMMSRAQLMETAVPTEQGRTLLLKVSERLALSARSHDRILRVARTVADLMGDKEVGVPHISEAVQYRGDEPVLLAA